MTTQVKPTQTNADTWVLRCPRGHTSIPKSAESLDSYRCDSCGCSYDHGPYDATENAEQCINGHTQRQAEVVEV